MPSDAHATREVLVEATAIDRQGNIHVLPLADMGFSYRHCGVPPDWIGGLAAEVDLVVVEADGAAGKPLTAPRAYEPVIPAATDLLVPVVGADVIGAPLTPERVLQAIQSRA